MTKSHTKKILIIIVAYYGDQWLPRCINSLGDSLVKFDFSIIIVDNYGNQIPFDSIARVPHKIIKNDLNQSLGFAKANNFALSKTYPWNDYILFLNQDTISPPGWLDECVTILEKYPSIGALSPLIRNYDNTGWDPSFLACLTPNQEKSLQSNTTDAILYTEEVPAPALLVRTSVLKQTGPFDPIYGSYYEDYDLCHRILKKGYKVGICTTASIQHFSGSATNSREKELKRMQSIIRNRSIYRLRKSQENRWLHLAKMFFTDFPRRMIRGLLKTPSSQPPRVILLAYWDILQNIHRISSSQRDELAWQNYLKELNWPNH